MKEKLYFNWSSGKDSALALYKIQKEGLYKVDLLFTSISKDLNRVNMHGLRKEMLLEQTKSLGIALELLELPASTEMKLYNQLMQDKMQFLINNGYRNCAFGDIFLEDLKKYREEQLKKVGVKAHFPLWKRDTRQIMREFLQLGFKTIVVCAHAKWFDEKVIGQEINEEWINNLPAEVDPCGENGEFHSFCYDGPNFQYPVEFVAGECVKKSYPDPIDKSKKVDFWFGDFKVLKT